ncbi:MULTISPECIES: hypothetical protein [Candidatus Ichthyocystis]|uniref:Uncharacterized protein n=1 Tax=Candidatus Ichthyocystis hellenicum TaxID=1561003 RepID=A0A0S4M6S5_9BURK|nr:MULTISPECIES: hypothetical protein [Ichthyocystis]CUT17965.1 hypothetical protein Ark11_1152 [Candidatus Ichthyocystis hellenicum]
MESCCIDLCNNSCSDSISLVTNNDCCTPSNSGSSVSDLLQINCSFINPSSAIIYDIVSSINNGNKSEYLIAASALLESCMSTSLMYLRSIKIHPPVSTNLSYRSPECIYGDPRPRSDSYIKNDDQYGTLQYMCDYVKYCMLGNDETIEEKHEEEKFLESEARFLLGERDQMISEVRFLLGKRNTIIPNHQNKDIASISELTASIEPELTSDIKFETAAGCNSSYRTLAIGIRKAIERRAISRSAFITIPKDKSSIEHTDTGIIWRLADRFNHSNLIKERKLLRNAGINARDNCIAHFMKYYLSLRRKLELVARTKFKDTDELITKEFKLPVPGKEDLKSSEVLRSHPFSRSCPYYARPYYANFEDKICDDMNIVKKRMNNYCSSSKLLQF